MSSEEDLPPLTRLVFLQAAIAIGFATLVGVAAAVQFCTGLVEFGGVDYAPRVTLLSAVRALGPAVTASAGLLAALVWTHRVGVGAVRPNLARAAPWVVLLSVLGAPICIGLVALAGFLTGYWGYDVSWRAILDSRMVLAPEDAAVAALSVTANVGLAGALAWFVLPAMRRRSWSLLRKTGALWLLGAAARLASGAVTLITGG